MERISFLTSYKKKAAEFGSRLCDLQLVLVKTGSDCFPASWQLLKKESLWRSEDSPARSGLAPQIPSQGMVAQ